MIVTVTELKTNLGKYLDMVTDEEIVITKNGKEIARLSRPESEKIALLDSLVSVAKKAGVMDKDDVRSERLQGQ
ncbi:MAG: type II toxin-antitoxin system Phd/YefM family antitoxin [Erysipelotrichaceae bacterium]|nr:type II toxin-antitoxin system Phd/YefM family antitoxin [Erysipelotrichaceae bacterium]